jgi:PleD family two-component response regulator
MGTTPETPAAFLHRADSAMYAAKQQGRGCAYIAPAAGVDSPENAVA